jgi:hypothetical protein
MMFTNSHRVAVGLGSGDPGRVARVQPSHERDTKIFRDVGAIRAGCELVRADVRSRA